MAILVNLSAIATRGWVPQKIRNKLHEYSNRFVHFVLKSAKKRAKDDAMDPFSVQAVADLLNTNKDEEDDDIEVGWVRSSPW